MLKFAMRHGLVRLIGGRAVPLMWAWDVAVLANKATEPKEMKPEKRLFAFSILYLFAIFAALVIDAKVLG